MNLYKKYKVNKKKSKPGDLINAYKGFKVKKDNKLRVFGETDLDKKVIRINKKKSRSVKPGKKVRMLNRKGKSGELLDTIKHELLHVDHPKAKEKTIRKMTERATKRMSKKEKGRLYNLVK